MRLRIDIVPRHGVSLRPRTQSSLAVSNGVAIGIPVHFTNDFLITVERSKDWVGMYLDVLE